MDSLPQEEDAAKVARKSQTADKSDFVTILRSLDGPVTKKLVATPDGVQVREAKHGTFHSAEERTVDGLRPLAALLETVSTDPRKYVVRGALTETANRSRMRRLSVRKENDDPTLLEVPRRWLLLDVDSLELPANFDQFADAATTVAWVKKHLPAEFAPASCWYQFTSGAGVKPGLRIRLAFWLDRAVGKSDLKSWLGQSIPDPTKSRGDWLKEYPVDASVFNTSQPIFVAPPSLGEGVEDPLSGRPRSGLIVGAVDSVTVPEIAEPAPLVSVGGVTGRTGGATFEDCLAAIGDDGDGFHGPTKRAVAIYWSRNGAGADPETLRAALAPRIEGAHRDPKKHTADYIRQEIRRLPDLIDNIRNQQRTKEARAEAEFANADVRFPGEGIPLAAAVPALRMAIRDFFAVAVTNGRRQRRRYDFEVALQAFHNARRTAIAEIEFGDPATNADSFFADEAEAPAHPEYQQWGIRITAGAGKTRGTIERMVKQVDAGRTFIYAIPTHEKADEIAADFNRLAKRPIAEVWRGFDRDDPSAPEQKMCRRHTVAAEVLKSGGSISDLCGSKRRGFCPLYSICGYRRQLQSRPAVWLVPHALLVLPIPKILEATDALIIDEARDISNARQQEVLLDDLSSLRSRPWPRGDVIERTMRALAAAPPGGYLSRASFVQEELNPELCRRAAQSEKRELKKPISVFRPTDGDEEIRAAMDPLEATKRKTHARISFWLTLADFLESGALSAARMRVSGDAHVVHIEDARPVHDSWLDRPVLHLDATMDPAVARAWLPRLEVKADIRVSVGAGVTIRQITDRPLSYNQFVPGVGAKNDPAKLQAQENTSRKIMRRLEVAAAVERMRGGGLGVILPKAARAWLEAEWRRWCTTPPNLSFSHFGALRGLNSMESVTGLICLSRPEPSPDAVEAISRRLLNCHPRPSLAGGYYSSRPVGLRLAGSGRAVVKQSYHPDVGANGCLAQIRDAEVEQAVHRARPIRRGTDAPLAIDILTNVPMDIPVNHAFTFDDWIAEADPQALLLARGFLPDNWEGRSDVLRDLFPTAEAARAGFRTERTASRSAERAAKGGEVPYKSPLIRSLTGFGETWPKYRYRLRGARRSHHVAIDPRHGDPRAAWALQVSGQIDVFERCPLPQSGMSHLSPYPLRERIETEEWDGTARPWLTPPAPRAEPAFLA